MKAALPLDRNERADRCDVLSDDEERALALVREIVAGIRDGGVGADIEAIERALIGTGASKSDDRLGCEYRAFTLRGAHFTLLAQPIPGTGIEVDFDHEKR